MVAFQQMRSSMTNNFKYELFKQRREYLQLSLLDIVKRLYEQEVDISEETLRSWEEGKTTPDADRLPILAVVLKCKVHEFYS